MVRRTFIESLGVYLPEGRLSTKDIIEGCRIRPAIDLESLTGIKTRPVVSINEYALDLAIKAVSKCLDISRHGPKDIEMVISANICRLNGPKREFSFEPTTSAKIAAHFGFNQAVTFDISNACAGMFTALQIMDSHIKSGSIKRGLIVSGEYISHLAETAQKEISQPIDPQLASLTLGDSGAAIILEGTDDPGIGFDCMDLFTVAKHYDLCMGRISQKEHGGYAMYTDSAKAHKTAIGFISELVANMIKNSAWSNEKDCHTVPHQTSTRAIESIAKVINGRLDESFLSEKNFIINLENRGNTSTTSHFVALWDFIRNGAINSGDKLLFVILASGVTVGVAKYALDDLPQRIMKAENLLKRAS